jgi:hypothetical protein
MNVVFTSKYTFPKVAIVVGFVEENAKYIHCVHFVFSILLVDEVVECFIEFRQPFRCVRSFLWLEAEHVQYIYQLITNPRLNELLEDKKFSLISATTEGVFSNLI